MRTTKNIDRVIREAAEQARKRGEHEWGREHVLLSLTQQRGEAGVRAAEVLEGLGLDERRVREVIDRHRPPGPALEEPPSEPGKPLNQVTFAARQTEIFGELSEGGTPNIPASYEPGRGVNLANGRGWAGTRNDGAGNPTIDVNIPGIDITKLHFPP